MSKRWIASLALMAALCATPALLADSGKPKKHGKGHAKHAVATEQGWERRDGYEYHVYEGSGRPSGWSQGKKTGWGNCGMPPGQAKKYGCRTYVYQGRPHYYYYQDDEGRVFVRRPIVEVHGSIDIAR